MVNLKALLGIGALLLGFAGTSLAVESLPKKAPGPIIWYKNVHKNVPLDSAQKVIFRNALMSSGYPMLDTFLPLVDGAGEQNGYARVRANYHCGPKGGSGHLEITINQDDEHLYDQSGIEYIHFVTYSPAPTRLQTDKIKFVLDSYHRRILYTPPEEDISDSELFVAKFDDFERAIGRFFGLSETNVNNLNFLANVFKGIASSDDRSRDIANGNLLTGGLVYCTTVDYSGYDLIGSDIVEEQFSGGSTRATKLLKFDIKEGELGIKGFYLNISLREDFPWGVGPIEEGLIRRHYGASLIMPLDVAGKAEELKRLGYPGQ